MSLRLSRVTALVAVVLILLTISGCGGDPVPDITGQRVQAADFLLERAGFQLGEVEYDEDSDGPLGFIVSQSPRSTSLAAPGDKVDIVIAGPLLVRVPILIGKGESEVRDLLSEADLRRGPAIEEYNDYIPAGIVMAQTLSPGSRAPQDTKVSYTVSLGRKDAPVPGVVGRWEDEARSFLLTIGFPSKIDRENSPEPPGVVIGQWPDARTELDLGERVDLTISEGPKTAVVPDVRGMALDKALDALEDAGMSPSARLIGGVRHTEDAIVQSQEPVGGYVAPVGISIVLYAREPD